MTLIDALDRPAPELLGTLGGTWDETIFAECRRFGRIPEAEQAQVRSALGRDRCWALISWAEAMASLAVREGNEERLVYGLVGLSLVNRAAVDEREMVALLPLFDRAAQLVGADRARVVSAAARASDRPGRRWLSALPPAAVALPPTHREVGRGREFVFARKLEDWDPELELADFADPERGDERGAPQDGSSE